MAAKKPAPKYPAPGQVGKYGIPRGGGKAPPSTRTPLPGTKGNPKLAPKAATRSRSTGGGDLATPGGNVPGSSYNRDLSEKNRKYFAGSTKRAANRANTQKKGPR